jgi:hypothetical protein
MQNSIIDISPDNGSVIQVITLTEAKRACLVDHTIDDAKITDLIAKCTAAVEDACNISILEKEITLTADWHREQQLPLGPVQSIDLVKFRTGTTNGVAQYDTLAISDYTTDGELFKVFCSSRCGRHKIIYTAGYESVPGNLKLAILNEIAFRYENAGDGKEGLSEGARELSKPFINYSWA